MSERWHLHHGDSLEWLRTLETASVDAVVTDPPYASTGDSASVMRTSASPSFVVPKETQFFEAWIREHLAEWKRVLRPDGVVWATIDWRGAIAIEDACARLRIRAPFVGVWDRMNMGMGWALRRGYECFVVVAMERWKPKRHDVSDIWHVPWNSANRTTIHAAEKPVDLFRKAIDSFTDADALVLDPFAGSGTTGVAALLEGRRFLGCERDDRFAEVARERIGGTLSDGRASSKQREGAKQLGLFGGAQ